MESKKTRAQKKVFAEVIVVEGRDDTKRLNLYFPGIETIETNGSEISDETLTKIKKIAEKRELIVLTDPDFNGERIRRKVLEVAPNAKQAFLRRADAVPTKSGGSLGVEHASKETLTHALANLHASTDEQENKISRDDLFDLGILVGPNARKIREYVGDELGIGYANAQQFEKRLTTFDISLAELTSVVEQWSMNEKTSNRWSN